MPPASDGKKDQHSSVGCELSKFIPNETHLFKIQDAVKRVHDATFLAMELLNIHLRVRLQDPNADLSCFFEKGGNWLATQGIQCRHS